jgi:hypothetical protein
MTPDRKDYFFCEVKGPADRNRPEQGRVFQELRQISKKPIWELTFACL